ncbi:MAG: alpha/beta fold hydrolase [Planctomycetota bacterium]|nr:alpha/beta fold hydrolase [Planctomycetota bacterium]
MDRRRQSRFVPALMCLLICGCAQRFVELRERRFDPVADRIKLYAKGGPRPTERTRQVLRKYDLDNTWSDNISSIDGLVAVYRTQPTSEICYALAELNYIAGRKREVFYKQLAFSHFVASVAYSYAYLFSPKFDATRNVYDPWFRGASELYNSSLESGLRIAQGLDRFKPNQVVTVETCAGPIEFKITTEHMQWNSHRAHEFKFVSDYRVVGLNNVHETKGLGVPLIAIQHRHGRPDEQFYPKGLSFPVTAFLRWEGVDDEHLHARCTVELYDPLESAETVVADHHVPLESDLSTPLAHYLNNSQLEALGLMGLLRPDRAERVSGLYMTQPFQPDKIPVVMVHGIWSSPMTWMEALNDLLADPEIRQRYQFWFYLYPSGEPFLKTAADLRQDLAEVRRIFCEQESPPKMDEMVVIGHSMGGLISRLLTIDSGDRFIASITGKRGINQLDQDAALQKVAHQFVFEQQQAVRRVVTIGTPFRGSKFANPFSQFALRKLINLPKSTLDDVTRALARTSGLGHAEVMVPRTSLDALSPDSPILQTVALSEASPRVHYHNILGAIREAPLERNTDGVVTFASAHRDDVESELIVKADHTNVHRHPLAILELRRILMIHAAEVDSRLYKIRLARHELTNESETTHAQSATPIKTVGPHVNPVEQPGWRPTTPARR